MNITKVNSDWDSTNISEFVTYFERKAAEIDARFERGELIVHLVCSLIRDTLQHCGRELYLVLLRSVRYRWLSHIDIDEQRRFAESRDISTQIRRFRLFPGTPSVFDLREIDHANDLNRGDSSRLTFEINNDLLRELEVCLWHNPQYASIDSVLRHACWTHLKRMDALVEPAFHTPLTKRGHELGWLEREEFESHYFIALQTLERVVQFLPADTSFNVGIFRNTILAFRSTHWREVYLREFDQKFGSHLRQKAPTRRISLDPRTFQDG